MAFYNRGKAYKDKGELDRAIADYNDALRLNPKFALAFAGRGTANLAKDDEDGAIADLDRAIALNPNLASAYQIRGNAYRAKRNFDRAIADYDQSLRIAPGGNRVLVDRALATDAKGDNIQTDQDYQRVLVARLTISKRYPREARQRREEGLVRIAFSIDRKGKVISTRIELSSGSAALDEEALAMVARAQPFPPLPNQSQDQVGFVLPVMFRAIPADREGI
jgi:TonB family protein